MNISLTVLEIENWELENGKKKKNGVLTVQKVAR